MGIGLAKIMGEYNDDFVTSFGGPVTYTVTGGTAKTINGQFIEPFDEVEINGALYYSQDYSLIVKTTDIPAIALGDAFTIDGNGYDVIGVKPMQTDLTKVELQKT
jgi:hypothetical protein